MSQPLVAPVWGSLRCWIPNGSHERKKSHGITFFSLNAQTFTTSPYTNYTNLLQISVFSFKAQTFTYFPIEQHKFASNFDRKILHS